MLFICGVSTALAEPAAMQEQSYKLVSKGRINDAIKMYESYVKSHPTDLQAIYNKVWLLDSNQKVADLADCNLLIKADPEAKRFTNIYTMRANAYLNDDQIEKARADINRAIALKQESPGRYIVSYRLHQTRGEYKEALADINHLLQSEKAQSAYFYKVRALNYESLKEWDKALADWSSAIKANPKDAELLRERARLYGARQKLDLSIKDYGSMLKIDAKDELAFELRGKAQYKIGNYKECIADLTRSLELDPCAASSTYETRALAYEKLGDKINAAKDRESARKTRERY